jgi:hypothetical protein
MGYSWDENTKFFHSSSTIKYNKNTIMSLKDLNGQEKFKRDEKATILWESLGSSEFSHMHFNLQKLLQEVDGLEEMDNPFSIAEIDNIVKELL